MIQTVPAPHRLRQVSVGMVVAGLHLMGVFAWWTLQSDMHPARKDRELASIAVWLPALPMLSIVHATRVDPRHTPAQSGPRDSSTPERPVVATESTLPAGEAMARSLSEAVPAPPSSAPALDLTLSRKALTSLGPPGFAAQSPFHGRLPATVERAIAGAAATSGPWTEERIDNDHVRFRRGNTCVMMERPQAATIDPFSDASRRIPWRASTSQCD